jgi:hypothetical protein
LDADSFAFLAYPVIAAGHLLVQIYPEWWREKSAPEGAGHDTATKDRCYGSFTENFGRIYGCLPDYAVSSPLSSMRPARILHNIRQIVLLSEQNMLVPLHDTLANIFRQL